MNQRLREHILIRDNRTCQLCNEEKENLDVHHIIPKKQQGRDDFNNLITLCHPCHMKLEFRKPPKQTKTIISLSLDDEVIDKLDELRGLVAFSTYLNDLLKEKLLK